MSAPLAEVVVVLYRSLPSATEEIAGFLDLAARDMRMHWTFVDNSEDQHDSALLAPLLADRANARLVRRPDNPGFAAACNLVGLRTDAPWLVLLNPDLLVTAEAFDVMRAAMVGADRSTAALAFSQRTGTLRHAGVAFSVAGWFMDRAVRDASGRSPGARELLYRVSGGGGRLVGPSGGAAAYRADAFRALGGFHDEYFAWGEDADLALRLDLAGLRTGCVDVDLPHQGGHSVVGPGVQRRARLLARNRVLLAARLYTAPQAVAFAAFFVAVLAAKVPLMLRDGTLTANLLGVVSGCRAARSARRSYDGARLRLRDGLRGPPRRGRVR
ncbi:hypothetical protein ICW40_05410 [Actinotalea ferrariae]|uniref:glycosyltransferase family 2 protein n=1 Tax=Actinotalea ferrariae TaxID=1386098 RepID=UPI001C8B7C54|nr:glycosyltransferase family 2 protein [Actinotalea ferrariae]MBX9244244.1 hypothetical protein [Actinotalea ferrariae]